MGLFMTTVLKWKPEIRDSGNRVNAVEHDVGRQFILNTNRISDVKVLTATTCSFQYSDNPNSRRESLSYLEVLDSAANIIAHFDDVAASNAVTLPICPYNSPYKGNPVFPLRTPVNTTILVSAIAYVDRYNPDPLNYVWVCYYKGAFKRMEVLCSLDSDIYPNFTTTTTSTTTEQR